jgi:hypothetical protein
VSTKVRFLILRMASENPTWEAPRIHGELLKLGFNLSEPTVSRWLRRAPRTPDPAQRWLTFLRNHREAIAAMDFFTVRRSRLGFCIASLSSVTTGGRSFAAREPEIRVLFGSYNRCGKRGRTRRGIASCFSTVIQNVART